MDAPGTTPLKQNIGDGDLLAIFKTNEHWPFLKGPTLRAPGGCKVVLCMPYDLSLPLNPDVYGVFGVDQTRINRFRVEGIQSNVISIICQIIATQDHGIGLEGERHMIFEVDSSDQVCEACFEQNCSSSSSMATINGRLHCICVEGSSISFCPEAPYIPRPHIREAGFGREA